MSRPNSVVVVGGGISGLAAAWRLEQAGVEVTVLEEGPGPGGRVQTERVGDYLVDTGPDAATEGYERWLALVDELGLSERLTTPSAVLGMIRDGRIVDVDPSKPLRALRTPVLSARAKARLGWGALRLRGKLKQVDSYELTRSSELDDPSSNAYDFAVEHFGTEAADYLLDPAIRLATGSGAREASTLSVLGVLTAWSVGLVNIEGGLASVPVAISERLQDLRYGARVTGLEERDGRVTASYESGSGQSGQLEADGCVIGAMFDAARQIWPRLDELAPDFAPNLSDVKLTSVTLGYTRRPDTDAYVVTVPTREYPDVLLIFMQHHKAPDRAPAGHGLITLYSDTLATDRIAAMSDAEIEEWAAGELEALCPELAGHREVCVVTRWPKAGYLATPGFWSRSRDLLAALAEDSPIQLAGDLFGAGSMESSVRWGERAAARLLAQT